MGKKVRKIASVATLGASDLALSPIESALGAVTGALTPEMQSGSTVTAPATTPTAVDADVQAARDATRKRQAAASGLSSTVLTSASGLSGGGSGLKTLLGS